MKKKILAALDDSSNSMRAVEFIAGTFSSESKITLFSVIPDTATLCEMNSPELTPYFSAQQSSFCILENKKRELVKEALEKAKKLLLDAGFDEDSISTKIENKKRGIARDILAEADSGYDILVLGRRGLSGIKEFFLGSVSQKVLHSAKDVAIVIVS